MIENNKVVSIEYEVKDASSDNVLDSNKSGVPLEFLMGANQVISGLENALLGKKVGDNLSINIAPEDAYGLYQTELIQEVERSQFEGIELKEGMTLFGQSDDGQSAQVVVKDFNDNIVIIDYNHPLAGKTLAFEVKVLDVRDASEVEIMQGGVGGGCSSGGHEHHHGGGGCCGGGGCGCGH